MFSLSQTMSIENQCFQCDEGITRFSFVAINMRLFFNSPARVLFTRSSCSCPTWNVILLSPLKTRTCKKKRDTSCLEHYLSTWCVHAGAISIAGRFSLQKSFANFGSAFPGNHPAQDELVAIETVSVNNVARMGRIRLWSTSSECDAREGKVIRSECVSLAVKIVAFDLFQRSDKYGMSKI